MKLEFEPVSPEHADELVRIRIAAMRDGLTRIGRFDPDRARDRFLSGFIPEHTRFIIHDGCRVGFVVVKPAGWQLKLDHLYIEPEYQGCGIGSKVLQWVFNAADEKGLQVSVTALRGSDSNRFYEKHGFTYQSESEWDVNYIRMQLLLPSAIYEGSYRDYIRELGDEERYPFPLDFDYEDFPNLLTTLKKFQEGTDLSDEFVPATTYWLVDGKELLGVSNLRHYLNDRIRHSGGHIGLGIRPSQRGKGLGKLLLKLTIEKAAQLGIQQIHIHCDKDNEASARMIRTNGGKLESEIEDEGEIIQRYVVSK